MHLARFLRMLLRLADEVCVPHNQSNFLKLYFVLYFTVRRGSGYNQPSCCTSWWCCYVCCWPQETNRWKYHGSRVYYSVFFIHHKLSFLHGINIIFEIFLQTLLAQRSRRNPYLQNLRLALPSGIRSNVCHSARRSGWQQRVKTAATEDHILL